jgi:hypothetical protein
MKSRSSRRDGVSALHQQQQRDDPPGDSRCCGKGAVDRGRSRIAAARPERARDRCPRTLPLWFAGEPLIVKIESTAARVVNVSTAMMTAEPMITRGVHYTALVDTIDHQGATKLHATEREQLLEAADVLLFGEPDSKWAVRSAEVLIEALETSERWSVESCDLLREHLSGCDAPTGAS